LQTLIEILQMYKPVTGEDAIGLIAIEEKSTCKSNQAAIMLRKN